MDWADKQQCLLCNRGGKLLVCNCDGCPISVHNSCMGCEAHMDDSGNFHCPYCLYRRLTAETRQLKEKAMLAKKALLTFLDEEMRDGNHEEPTVGMSIKKEQISAKDDNCLLNGSNLVCDDVRNQCVHLEKHQHFITPSPCEGTRETFVSKDTDGFRDRPGELVGLNNVNTCRIMVVYEPNLKAGDLCNLDRILPKESWMKTDLLESDVGKRVGTENRTRFGKCKFDGVVGIQQHSTSMEEEAQSNNAVISSSIKNQITPQKRNHSVAFNRNGNTNIINPAELKDSSKQLSVNDRSVKLPLQYGKRRVRWSDEEEDMLKEGVQKFSLPTRKNLPWKKILEFGRHIFDACRTPSDLKDKWRNMAK